MSVSASRSEQAAARFAEARSLAEAGFRERAVEALHAAAELAIEELAEREDVEITSEQLGWHEARARAAARLRADGLLPAGFENLLRRLNDDRKRTKYDDKPTRFDPLTFAGAEATVRIVIESLGVRLEPESAEAVPEPPAPVAAPPPEPRAGRRGLAIALVVAAVLVLVGAAALVAFQAGEDRAPPKPPRATAPGVVPYGRTAHVGRLAMHVDTARTGPTVARPSIRSRRGTFVLVDLRVSNPSDRTLPLRVDAFRVRGGRGGIYRPGAGLTRFTLAIEPRRRQSLPLPFDVPVREVRGARLLADATSASGARRSAGATLDLALADGLAELMPGTWRGRTSEGRPFTMRVEKGDVVRSIRFATGRRGSCSVLFRGAAFVEGGRFRAGREALVTGAFSSSVEARGSATSAPAGRCRFGTVGWRASTRLR